jgi:hypothetical protein
MCGFASLRYQIFWEVEGLEQGPHFPVNTIEELLERNSSGFGLDSREYGHRDLLGRQRYTLSPQNLANTSPTSGGCSDGIVCSHYYYYYYYYINSLACWLVCFTPALRNFASDWKFDFYKVFSTNFQYAVLHVLIVRNVCVKLLLSEIFCFTRSFTSIIIIYVQGNVIQAVTKRGLQL